MNIKFENAILYVTLFILSIFMLFLDIKTDSKFICILLITYFITNIMILIQIEGKISIYGYFMIWSLIWTVIGYIRIFLINYNVENSILIKSIIMIFICYTFMTLFYIIFMKYKKGKYKKKLVNIQFKKLYIYMCIGYILTMFSRIVSLGGIKNFIKLDYVSRNFNEGLKLFPVLSFLFIIPLFFISIILLFEQQKEVSKKLVVLVLMVVVSGIIIEGNRGIFISIIPAMYYFYRKKVDVNKRWIKILIILIISAMLIMPTFLMLEKFRNKENTDIGANLKEKITYILQGRNFDTIENYIEVMKMYSGDNKLYGKTLIAPFVNFIPRSIWSNKPIGLGQQYVIDSPRFDNEGGFGIYIVGEFYANFGVVGVMLLPIAIAFILSRLEKSFSAASSSNNLTIKYYNLILMIYMTDIIRGDFLSGFTRFIYFYLFYLVMMIPVYRLKLRKK